MLSRAVRRRVAARFGRAGHDRGLTLIELLVTITILGIIVVPLTEALSGYFRNTDATTNRLSLSHDAQISAAYFAQDVASMGRRDWTATDFPPLPSFYLTTAVDPCGAGDQLVMRLLRDDPTAANVTPTPVLRVAYWVKTVGGQKQLHRVGCNASGTVTSDAVVAHNLFSFTVGCPPATCADATTPQAVRLTLVLRSPTNGTDSLTVTLDGQRRPT
jgi:prepilin-type N-terminal cleavage/methylation domain-containing protein